MNSLYGQCHAILSGLPSPSLGPVAHADASPRGAYRRRLRPAQAWQPAGDSSTLRCLLEKIYTIVCQRWGGHRVPAESERVRRASQQAYHPAPGCPRAPTHPPAFQCRHAAGVRHISSGGRRATANAPESVGLRQGGSARTAAADGRAAAKWPGGMGGRPTGGSKRGLNCWRLGAHGHKGALSPRPGASSAATHRGLQHDWVQRGLARSMRQGSGGQRRAP